MILWYTTPAMRARWLAASWEEDQTLLEQLVEEAMSLLAVWSPTTAYHWEVVEAHRTLEWLVWQVAVSPDETWSREFQDVELIEPWAIDLATLPRYGGMPTGLGQGARK